MINVKTPDELVIMRKANLIVRDVLLRIEDHIKPGVTTSYLDQVAREHIEKAGARPSFLNYQGYPASICASIDDVVVHGIPSKNTYLEEGMIIGIDVGAFYNGFHGDAARTFAIGRISPEKAKLVKVTKESFFKAIERIKDGVRLGDISSSIQQHVESNGFSVVRALVGHGIGREMHEEPSVPNYGEAGRGIRLHSNMTIAIEPMVNAGEYLVKTDRDGWTVRTKDGSPSAHYENTVLITEYGAEILTL
ncbi:MAG: type I methionyl aminopeptidase [Clostridia bacterium]|nr:type I methionyl aminopeptidase [Clostridia bacterium]